MPPLLSVNIKILRLIPIYPGFDYNKGWKWGDVVILKNLLTELKKHIGNYLVLLITLELFNFYILIPIFREITTIILQGVVIPFVSVTSTLSIITNHPVLTICLILELGLLLYAVYLQFTVILVGIAAIRQGITSIRAILSLTWQKLKQMHWSSFPLLCLYFILILPGADFLYKTPLLSKIQIPAFIQDVIAKKAALAILMGILYLIMLYLGWRLLYTLPGMIFDNRTSRQAMRDSFAKTRGRAGLKVLGIIFVISVVSAGLTWLWNFILVASQFLWDSYSHGRAASWVAVTNLSLIQLGNEISLFIVTIVTILYLLPRDFSLGEVNHTRGRFFNLLIWGTVAVFSLATVINNIIYMQGWENYKPVIISHRGVSDGNGVQNAIPAMRRTAKLGLDYIEIDVHETMDHQFVVMHDENLKTLTGVDKAPYQLTLAQLTKLTAKENGARAKVVSLDHYMWSTEKLGIDLLIEIKTTDHDSKNATQRFLKKYRTTILKNKWAVHSLNYDVVKAVEKAGIKTGYLMPYNLSYPQIKTNAYGMEYSTLNQEFVTMAHSQHRQVYAWTVNDADSVKSMLYMGVDGLVTDDVQTVKQAVREYDDNHSYTMRLWNYLSLLGS